MTGAGEFVEVREHAGGIDVAVKVSAGARRNAVLGVHAGRLRLAVTAAPDKGKANDAVCRLVADWLGIKNSAVALRVGAASPLKRLRIEGITAAALRARLEGLTPASPPPPQPRRAP